MSISQSRLMFIVNVYWAFMVAYFAIWVVVFLAVARIEMVQAANVYPLDTEFSGQMIGGGGLNISYSSRVTFVKDEYHYWYQVTNRSKTHPALVSWRVLGRAAGIDDSLMIDISPTATRSFHLVSKEAPVEQDGELSIWSRPGDILDETWRDARFVSDGGAHWLKTSMTAPGPLPPSRRPK